MKLPFKIYHFRSFARRLSAYVCLVAIIIFSVVIGTFYSHSEKSVLTNTFADVHCRLKLISDDIEKALLQIQYTNISHEQAVKMNLSQPDSLYKVLVDIMNQDKYIVGCSLSFIPNYYPQKGYYFMLYAIRKNGRIVVKQIGSEEYNYPGQDWFIIPQRLKKDYWNDPYFDKGAGNIVMSTFSHPILDKSGKMIALIGTDISLEELTQHVKTLKPFTKNTYTFVISRNGYYLTHKEKNRILNETILSNAFEHKQKEFTNIGMNMMRGETGTVKFDNDGVDSYAFYTRIPTVGWSVCSVSPSEELLSDINSTTRLVIFLFFIGLLLIALLTYWIIQKLTSPVTGFAKAASQIAKGNFDILLPKVKTRDEICTLGDALENMRISLKEYIKELKETTASKERIEHELSIAHNIQMGMLPKIFPDFPERNDIDLFATLRPAKEVGGDLYDFFIRGRKLFFAIGDVSGKGVPASLFMAITSSLFRTLLQIQTTPEGVLKQMNASICENNETNMFVTMIVGILDLSNGKLELCNAGHNPPILIKEGQASAYLEMKKNVPIGVVEDFDYQPDELILKPNEKLITYTDGVTEAESVDKELYGETRLLKIIEAHRTENVREQNKTVTNDIALHTKGAVQSDDITLMNIHYKPRLSK